MLKSQQIRERKGERACEDDSQGEQNPGEPTLQPVVDAMAGVMEAMRGRMDPARELYEASHLAFDGLGLNVQLASFRMYAGWAELIAGDAAAAERELRA